MRIGPARDVAGGKDAGHAGLETGIDGDAAVDRQSRLLGQREARAHADADHDQVGLERAAALQRGALAVDRGDGVAEMEDDAVLLVQRAHEVAELGAEDALHRPRLGRDHMHLDVAGAQRRGDLEADEARADHDRALGVLRIGDDGAAVGERAQRMHMRLVGAGDRQAHRLGAGGEQQAVVRHGLAVAERDLARLGVDRGDIGRQAAGRSSRPHRSSPSAAAPSPPARCRRDSPSTGWAGRPAAPSRWSIVISPP